MEIKTIYDIGDEVEIKPLGLKGIVTKILCSSKDLIEYEVRYFKDSDLVFNYFRENELEYKSNRNSLALS